MKSLLQKMSMKITTLAALLALVTCLGSAKTAEPQTAALKSAVVVTEVNGSGEYAYDSTGWRKLTTGKVLQPGATVRASQESFVILKTVHSPSLIRVSQNTQLHLTLEAPDEERAQQRLVKAGATAKGIALTKRTR